MPASGGTGSGAFTRFGGYSGTWPGFIRQMLDIYIDPAAGAVGDGRFLDNAITCSELARTTKVATLTNCDPAGTSGPLGWLEAGGVGAEKTGAAEWSIAADADGGAYPGGGIQITTAGWYTVVSHWGESAANTGAPTDTIDRNTFIYDSSGTLIYSDFNPNQHLLEDSGGWRYGWMGKNALAADTTVAVDNSTLLIGITETQLDHFQCYDARRARGEPRFDPFDVDLIDQFGESMTTVRGPALYCVPVDKNGEGVANPAARLTCYDIRPGHGRHDPGDVDVENQFGEQSLTLRRPKLLCVPSTEQAQLPE